MSKHEDYEGYDDWYDHGPGSESFKRACRSNPMMSMDEGGVLSTVVEPTKNKRIKTKKNGKNIMELLGALNRHLKADHKLSPTAHIPKGLLEEIVREGRRLYRYVEELESD
jgi:hypothetical protein